MPIGADSGADRSGRDRDREVFIQQVYEVAAVVDSRSCIFTRLFSRTQSLVLDKIPNKLPHNKGSWEDAITQG